MLDGRRSAELSATARVGVCAPASSLAGKYRNIETDECHTEDYGAFTHQQQNTNNNFSLAACVDACDECARCRALSYAPSASRCLWFSRCDLDDLRPPPHETYTDWRTLQRKPLPRYVPPPTKSASDECEGGSCLARKLRLAIVTMMWGAPVRCGLLQWCQRVELLRERLPAKWKVDILVIGDEFDPRDCECAVRVPIAPEMLAAMNACRGRLQHKFGRGKGWLDRPNDVSGSRSLGAEGAWRTLAKWQVFQLDYDVAFFADTDVSMLPESINLDQLGKQWLEAAPELLKRGHAAGKKHKRRRANFTAGLVRHRAATAEPLFLGHHDRETPVNLAFFIARPSPTLYLDGLAQLSRCSFTRKKGWMESGTPLTLFPPATMPPSWSEIDIQHTSAFTKDSWFFPGAQHGQGFFWYMLFVRHSVGGYLSTPWPLLYKTLVDHYRGQPKPWRLQWEAPLASLKARIREQTGCKEKRVSCQRTAPRALGILSRAYAYVARTDLRAHADANASDCVMRLWTIRKAIEEDDRFAKLTPH